MVKTTEVKNNGRGYISIDPYVKLTKNRKGDLDKFDSVRITYDLEMRDNKKILKDTFTFLVKSGASTMHFDTSIEQLEKIVDELKQEKKAVELGKWEK